MGLAIKRISTNPKHAQEKSTNLYFSFNTTAHNIPVKIGDKFKRLVASDNYIYATP